MCGPPLLYLKRCGHKMTPRFPAPGNTSIYLSISDKSHSWLANSSPLEVCMHFETIIILFAMKFYTRMLV